MKHIIRAVVVIAILYFAANYFKYSGYASLINILLLIASLYLVAAIIGSTAKLIRSNQKVIIPAKEESAKKKELSGLWLFLIILFLALTYGFKETLGKYSFKTFLFLDNLVKLTDAASPLLFWAVLGLFTGAIYGSFVAWKKYKLNASINLLPIGIFVLVITFLFLVNKPTSKALVETNHTQTIYAYHLVTAEVSNGVFGKNATLNPALLLDSSDNTAWITDVVKSTAEVQFLFKGLQDYANKNVQCVGFLIANGYRKSPKYWDNFARVQSISIKHNGTFITSAAVSDKKNGSEKIIINSIPLSSFDNVSITINTIYPGQKYPARVAIAELVPIIQYEAEE